MSQRPIKKIYVGILSTNVCFPTLSHGNKWSKVNQNSTGTFSLFMTKKSFLEWSNESILGFSRFLAVFFQKIK